MSSLCLRGFSLSPLRGLFEQMVAVFFYDRFPAVAVGIGSNRQAGIGDEWMDVRHLFGRAHNVFIHSFIHSSS